MTSLSRVPQASNKARTGRHVVVIGAGAIGLCTALYCRRLGMTVTVVDREPRQRSGCSFGNQGMIVPSHFIPLAAPGAFSQALKWIGNPESPFAVRLRCRPSQWAWGFQFWRSSTRRHVEASAPVLRDLHLWSRECYAKLHDEGLDFSLVRAGLLMLCKTQAALDEEAHVAEMANRLGVTAEVFDAAATARQDPQITMDVLGSVYFPRDGHLNPERLMAALESELIDQGVTFHWETEVLGFRTQGGVQIGVLDAVTTSAGEISGDQFVLSGGIWSTQLARSLRLRLPMQAGKGYSLTLPQPRQLPRLCSICTEARVAVTPLGETLRFGGTMEVSGEGTSISARRVRGITQAIPDYFPVFQTSDFASVQPWSGLRPVSPDGLPYLGRAACWSNLVVATGHAMMGISLAPATGELVSRLLTDQPISIPLERLAPDRFG